MNLYDIVKITTQKLADLAVTTSKIVDLAVTTGKIADSAVSTAKIADSAITNAKVSASAAISGTKISPNFGSQDISTTGTTSLGTTTLGTTTIGGSGGRFPNGSSAAPSISFTSDTNSGMFRPSGDNLAFVEGGIEAMRITSSGSVGIGTSSVNADAILQLDSTTKGFLPPRMTTTQRDAIPSPVPAGLVIYNTTTNVLNFYNGSAWGAV